MRIRIRRLRPDRTIARFVAVAVVTTMAAGPATVDPVEVECASQVNDTYEELLECVRVDGVHRHLAAFQQAADDNGGNRAAGTGGYEASVEYVAERLRASGWEVELHQFPFSFIPAPRLALVSPDPEALETGAFYGTGVGAVVGPVTAVDLALDNPSSSTSGCEATDFAAHDWGGEADIALVQRGTCRFAVKAANAEAAGAEAVVIFNQGGNDRGLIVGSLGGGNVVGIPVVGTTFANGLALGEPGVTARVEVDPPEERSQANVVAELGGANPANVVMAGAHLDSVGQGPGINDNGSGSAVLIEVAEALAGFRPQNTLRFVWWGAEEAGLLGSTAYVQDLTDEGAERIALYLNFDMVGSPNHIFTVYDADQSSGSAGVPIPEGSVAIEDLFESHFDALGVAYADTGLGGRSDYFPFVNRGIPVGGLFTGAEGVKSLTEQATWGGITGQPYDSCYHGPCDDLGNISLEALDVNSDAVAMAVLTYAYSTEAVNGTPGQPPPRG